MAQSVDSRADIVLLKKIAGREMSAVSELYDRHANLLYSVILRILRDEGEAEDTLQEVFFRIWERADTYKEALGPPAIWLTRISRNLAIDKLRSRVSRARRREEDLEAQIDLHDERPGSSPMQFTINSQQQQAVAEALMNLPQEQRVLIEYAYFQGFTQSELAEHFQLPLGTVKTRIRSAMSALRERLYGLAKEQ
jgi:RNA polymerase sigma-70 factor (ECF subfamily)